MSHLVTIKTQIRDPAAVRAACTRLKLEPPVDGEHVIYERKLRGLGVKLTGWTFPVVCRTESGELDYDNYSGAWGNMSELNKFKQAYAVEKAKIEARKAGHLVTETAMPNGKIKLTLSVMGT
jgi:hypothetical protein